VTTLAAPPRLIGSDVEVPCADGVDRRYVNLDHAASTPVPAAVWEAVEAFVPWYSSVHRGTGAKSRVLSTPVRLVTDDDVIWAEAPERFEAGSPNVIGAVALAAACDTLDMRQAEARTRC
jgi:selenocysteine lyase/cysteine desulfurase